MDKAKLLNISKKISSGLTPLRSNEEFWINGDIPWLKTEQLGKSKYIYETNEKITEQALNQTSIKLCPPNTLSIAMYGEGKTRGSVSIIKHEMTTNQACCNIIIDENKAYYEYVYYFLKTQYSELRNLSSGVRKNLNSNDIKNFEIRLPDNIETQQKIASILSTLEKKIALNNQINQELEAMAKTLYDYWFVQFDFPNEEGKPYKSSGGKMVYSEELKREIPEGWEVRELSDEFNILNGYAFKSSDYVKDGIFVLRTKNFTNSFQVAFKADDEYLPVNFLETYKAYICEAYDYHLVMVGASVGKRGLIYSHQLPAFRNQNMWCFRAKKESKISHAFIKQSLDSIIQKYVHSASGSAREFLTKKNFKSIKIVLPHIDILTSFEEKVFTFMKLQASKSEETQKLTQLRDWLLPMLMNGQVSVADATEQVEELMVAEPEQAYGK